VDLGGRRWIGGTSRSATLTVNPAAPAMLLSLSLNPKMVVGGSSVVATVTLNKVTSSPVIVSLASSKPRNAVVPASVTVPAGASSAAFNISTTTTNKKINATISASYGGTTKSATLAIIRR
jgi:hypothetical protein